MVRYPKSFTASQAQGRSPPLGPNLNLSTSYRYIPKTLQNNRHQLCHFTYGSKFRGVLSTQA